MTERHSQSNRMCIYIFLRYSSILSLMKFHAKENLRAHKCVAWNLCGTI